MLFLFSIAIVSAFISIWMPRRIAAPIREFAGAAERLGRSGTPAGRARTAGNARDDPGGEPHGNTGCSAFWRIARRCSLRSRTIEAPLARLRLRAELVSDGEQQRKMFDDLDSMNAMIESTLAFARDDARQEPRTLVDLRCSRRRRLGKTPALRRQACLSGPARDHVSCPADPHSPGGGKPCRQRRRVARGGAP